jgi:hypothetical protein
MIDAIVQSGLLNTSSSPSTAAPTIPASAGDAEHFRALMNAVPANVSQPSSAAELGRPLAVGTGADSPSIGQSILTTIQDLSADTRARFAKAEEVLSKPDLTMTDMMSLQVTLLQTSVQFEIASKGITKLAQNVDAVLKTQ